MLQGIVQERYSALIFFAAFIFFDITILLDTTNNSNSQTAKIGIEMKKIFSPVTFDDLKNLKAGDSVSICGIVYTGRDAAHKRLCEMISNDISLPFDLYGSIIYYVGPTPARPGEVIGSAGPTSSYRMDPYTEPLLKKGLKVMIGKGPRSEELKNLLKKYGAIYVSAIGGTAAKISETIKKCEVIAFDDLDTEAIRKLWVEDFYGIVTYDMYGNDLFEEGVAKYRVN